MGILDFGLSKTENSTGAGKTGLLRRSGPRNDQAAGFTLIELLVVVAIIAVLVAILLPVLGKARALSQKTVCMTEIKQLGMATQYYMQDNQDWFPHYGSYGGLVYLMQKYLPRPDMTSQYSEVYSYSRVWICPIQPTNNPWGPSPAYSVNAAFAWGGVFWGQAKMVKMGDIPDPSRILWMTEGTYYTAPSGTYIRSYEYDRTDWQPDRWVQECFPRGYASCRWVSYRHAMSANVLFADGHVESMPEGKLEGWSGWTW